MIELKRNDLYQCYFQSNIRGLKQSSKWAAELLYSLSNDLVAECDSRPSSRSDFDGLATSLQSSLVMTDPEFLMAKSCFDLGEYDRASFFLRFAKLSESRFLYYYSRYLSAEKKRLDTMVDANCTSTDVSMKLFSELRAELQQLYICEDFNDDGYLLYVYGIVLLKLDLTWDAIEVFCKGLKKEPLNWASWHQLALIIDDKSQLDSLDLPSHWFKKFFLGIVYLELQLNEEALELYNSLKKNFSTCNYVLSQIAIAKHNLRDVDGAIELFKTIRESDPARLDSMDIYSNLLYVKDKRAELSTLAHAANSVDPFRVETCCCIANFYSLRSQHPKAVIYFSRALQLNPRHLSAWTLMGHEYMEMKNTGAAIQAYRSAIKCNKRDYRAWYGLGQTYEILKMPSYCLYYYSVAHSLRPNDFRLTIATGETLEKLDRTTDALKCYWKAGSAALYKLASLYEKMNERDKAAAAYTDFINRPANINSIDGQGTLTGDVAHAYKFLAQYHLVRNELKLAHIAAQKCSQFSETRDEAKEVLKQITKASKNPSLELT